MNGSHGRVPIKVKKMHYPEEFRMLKEKISEYDFGVMELEDELDEIYGYLGIDTSSSYVEGVENVEIYGYPGNKERHTMWYA